MTDDQGKVVSIRRPVLSRSAGFDVSAFPRFAKESHNPGLRPELIVITPAPESGHKAP